MIACLVEQNDETPLYAASHAGHLPVVKFLVEQCKTAIDANTANVERNLNSEHVLYPSVSIAEHYTTRSFTCEDGCSALHAASAAGKLDVVQYLTECAADLHATDSVAHA